MKRWNGWGDELIVSSAPHHALAFLQKTVGRATPPKDAPLAEVVRQVPPSHLPNHPLVSHDGLERLRHARGQSLPDWIALRSGQIGRFPDGVAFPEHAGQVRELLTYAQQVEACVIPYGGGTSVVGHINPLAGNQPVLTIDMGRMNRLQWLDKTNQLATFGAGVSGPDLEAQLRAQGYTLGHYPQSFEYSTLGGWVATRSSGQQSLGYGRIEQLFAGGHVETPMGAMELPPFPASAAGLDLREVVLGSEGRLGLLTEGIVRVRATPALEQFPAIFFPTWEQATAAARQMAQARVRLSMIRLNTPGETRTALLLAGHARAIAAFEHWLAWRGVRESKCFMLLGVSGSQEEVKLARRQALRIARAFEGAAVGSFLGRQWQKRRFQTPYLRNTLWERGYAIDTLETATTWNRVPTIVNAIESALSVALDEEGERVHVFTHLSHLYPQGSAIYTTYIFRLASDPQETLRRWSALKRAASQAIVEQRGTISHQHGVGLDHLPYLSAEKGELGLGAMQALFARFDPNGMLNPGKLVAASHE